MAPLFVHIWQRTSFVCRTGRVVRVFKLYLSERGVSGTKGVLRDFGGQEVKHTFCDNFGWNKHRSRLIS